MEPKCDPKIRYPKKVSSRRVSGECRVTLLVPFGAPNGAKRVENGAERTQNEVNGVNMEPKCGQNALKNSMLEKGWLQEGVRTKGVTPKYDSLAEKVAPRVDFGGHFGAIFH